VDGATVGAGSLRPYLIGWLTPVENAFSPSTGFVFRVHYYFHWLFRQTAELAALLHNPQTERRVICEHVGNKWGELRAKAVGGARAPWEPAVAGGRADARARRTEGERRRVGERWRPLLAPPQESSSGHRLAMLELALLLLYGKCALLSRLSYYLLADLQFRFFSNLSGVVLWVSFQNPSFIWASFLLDDPIPSAFVRFRLWGCVCVSFASGCRRSSCLPLAACLCRVFWKPFLFRLWSFPPVPFPFARALYHGVFGRRE